MDQSENQFQELIAHLVARINKLLAEDKELPPLGLSLNKNGTVELYVSTTQGAEDAAELLNLIQQGLSAKVDTGNLVATAISYPDFENNEIIVFLENNENYCTKLIIPVNVESTPVLVVEDIEVEDGTIYIFPAA